ncbi:putative fatty acyl-CoA reductase CG5065 isoform X2 [Diabrotica virgifera virgifera]|uniref:Fatty acyl-CoA reductase n=1 Tax=Diabrotica virgifera virgifera TaxID=50390 RepID=A0A6P7GDC3_DIAVI|nr:putative fatty acyl-CoA reductase CG5065 isoform X2 [Diabrotica virgifera virgifera]
MLIAEYFTGKHIFITGGTGFMGKVLIEKLLRSCPTVGNIYILIREKKGRSIQERIESMQNLPIFQLLKKTNPDAFKKMIPIRGDVTDVDLGLSADDRKMLIENVNIIYHSAASVRFDDFLKDAILINIRGTREVAQLALETKNLDFFLHVSTTFCNTDKVVVEEKLYPPHGDWRATIRLAEECDEALLCALSEKYIRPLPNTYTFAKSLAEHVVNDMCFGKVPVVIARPSVVVSTLTEPIEGWNANFNGPVGLLVAGGKGILRTTFGNPVETSDYIPVDLAIKVIIMATVRYGGIVRESESIEVLNLAQGNIARLTLGELVQMGRKLILDTPFSTIMWYPRFSITNCWYNFYIQTVLFHMVPAFFVDLMLRLVGKKPMLWYLDIAAKLILFCFLVWILTFKLQIISRVFIAVQNYYTNL